MYKEKEVLWDLVESAWGIIANASNSDWSKESKQWNVAAKAWRGRYHQALHERMRKRHWLHPRWWASHRW